MPAISDDTTKMATARDVADRVSLGGDDRKKREAEEEVVLPGYAAGIDESGVQHSKSKLQKSSGLLHAKLQEIKCSHSTLTPPTLPKKLEEIECSNATSTSSLQEKQSKLALASSNHLSIVGGMKGSIQTFHCQDEKETWTYRCRCNFQIVRVNPDDTTKATASSLSTSKSYRYAMRSMGEPLLLGTNNSFPIATRRIQSAMKGLMEHLNKKTTNDEGASNFGHDDLIGLDGHLTSCTFSSAWRDTPDADCVLTLHYDYPLKGDKTTESSWKQQSQQLREKLRLRQLNGRSKGVLLSVKEGDNLKNENNNENDKEATIRDTIYLLRSDKNDNANGNYYPTLKRQWKVCLDNKFPSNIDSTVTIPVHYDKPETAFYHPNSNAMTTALAWMLNQLEIIASSSSPSASSSLQKLNLLEMYCGCGAHTIALGRSGLVSNIIAVELDPRLVRACEINVAKNSLQDLVNVQRGDAGRWAKEESRKLRSRRRKDILQIKKTDNEISDNHEITYDILLVDPPRQGLDEDVCSMAMMTIDGEDGRESTGRSCFRNILYVSCGHRALLRDLERLSPVYEVANCMQMDLFPRTDSIETLVHLRRRDS